MHPMQVSEPSKEQHDIQKSKADLQPSTALLLAGAQLPDAACHTPRLQMVVTVPM